MSSFLTDFFSNLTMVLLYVVIGGMVGLLLAVLAWDKGRRSLVLALRSLWLHKMRSFLSVLGIIIGTGAVIALMAFGEGSMHDALEDIKRMGATNIIVRSTKPPEEGTTQRRSWIAAYGITFADYEKLATIPTITRMVPLREFPQEIRYLDRVHSGRLVGTTPEYAEVNQLELAAGRFLTDDDDLYIDNVAVLGSATADKLFPFEEALGRSVKVGSSFYKVVGVLRDRMPTGGTGGSQSAVDYNQDVYIPLRTLRGRFGERIYIRSSGSRNYEQVQLSQITLTVNEMDMVRPTESVIRGAMEKHLKADWVITVPLDRLEEAERAKERYKRLLVQIGGISLLVGGIGIMNIMLATVTERTREIGIRRALGAKRRDITMQFLIEAVVQTTVGGLFGVLLGLGIVYVIPPAAEWLAELTAEAAPPLSAFFAGGNAPVKLHGPSIFMSLAVAVGVGVLFGWYPARRASMLDPIEALRHE